MTVKRLTRANDKQKQKFVHFLAEGEEVVAVFGIGERYFWLTVASYFLLIFLLVLYPWVLLKLPELADARKWQYLFYTPSLLVTVIGLPYIVKLIHLKHKMAYIFTDRRVLVKDGVLSVKLTAAPYDKISHLTVKEDFLKRISYQIGDITIHTAGPTPVEIDLVKVQHPMQVKNLLEELIVKERSLLGTFKEKESLVKPLI